MRCARKLSALLLALALVLSLSITAFAVPGYVYGGDEGPLGGGSITIVNAIEGHEYKIYQILYLESYYIDYENNENSRFVYKVNPEWEHFVNRDGIRGYFLDIDDQGYVTWIMKDKEGNDAGADEFARLARDYIKEYHEVHEVGMGVAYDSNEITFENLKFGYYLVDSTVGTLCALFTSHSDIWVYAKSSAPINVKTVQEDDTAEGYDPYGSVNDAEIGQKINFRSTITIPAGSENVVFHDFMRSGLELDVYHPDDYGNVIKVYSDEYDMDQELDPYYYTVNTSPDDGCTFEISFNREYLEGLAFSKKTAQLRVEYSAYLTDRAEIGNYGNENTSYLSYGEDRRYETPPSTTRTYTWSFDVLKYANGDKSKVLEGAEFVLLNSDKTKFAIFSGGSVYWDVLSYWVPLTEFSEFSDVGLSTNEEGRICIAGLDSGTYYLREIKAPDGYNKLDEDTEVVIQPDRNNDYDGIERLTLAPVTAEINNQSGTELPSTGGMGTTLFYMVGSILLVGAAVLLVTKKRVSAA